MKPTESDDVPFGERAVYVAIVDISGDGDFMELVRSALSAAISALQPCDLFALVTVSEDIGIYDLRADLPSARQVAVEASGAGLALCDLIPLQEALVPVGQFAAQIQGAIESLLAQQEAEGMSTSAVEADDVPRQRKRRVGFGAAVSSVVELLGTSDHGRAYAPRLLSFLAGLPNHGPGSLRPRFANDADGRRQREREPSSLKPATTYTTTAVFAFRFQIRCAVTVAVLGQVLHRARRAVCIERDLCRPLCRLSQARRPGFVGAAAHFERRRPAALRAGTARLNYPLMARAINDVPWIALPHRLARCFRLGRRVGPPCPRMSSDSCRLTVRCKGCYGCAPPKSSLRLPPSATWCAMHSTTTSTISQRATRVRASRSTLGLRTSRRLRRTMVTRVRICNRHGCRWLSATARAPALMIALPPSPW